MNIVRRWSVEVWSPTWEVWRGVAPIMATTRESALVGARFRERVTDDNVRVSR